MMHLGAECIQEDQTLDVAARMMRDMDVGSLPICGSDERLAGIITDRDIVCRCIAEGHDPSTMTAMDLAMGTPIWVDADADEEEVLTLMGDNRIRRLPVIEDHRLVGMISEVDLARSMSEDRLAQFVEKVYAGATR
jgi:CBS domain-containing protein